MSVTKITPYNYYFAGYLGASDLPVGSPEIGGQYRIEIGEEILNIYPPQSYYIGGRVWAEAIANGINSAPDAYYIPKVTFETGFSQHTLQGLTTEYALAQLRQPNGIFSILIPGAKTGFLNAALYETIHADSHIVDQDVSINSIPGQGSLSPVINAYNNYEKSASVRDTYDTSADFGDGLVTIGAVSHKSMIFGNGNHIIMASPVQTVWNYTANQYYDAPYSFYANRTKSIAEIMYPSSQGAFQSNSMNIGGGNNLVYFDSSFKEIKTDDGYSGKNIFLPSFGSFNWASDGLQASVSASRVSEGWEVVVPADNKTLLAPTPVESMPGFINSVNGTFSIADNLATIVGTFDSPVLHSYVYDYSDGREHVGLLTAKTAQAVYVGAGRFAPNTPLLPNGLVDATKANNIGGETIVGGWGDDTFYGVDPNFYAGVDQQSYGSKYLYVNPANSPGAERFNMENFTTVSFCGNRGDNTFKLGNPTLITPDGGQYTGVYSYKISLSHKYIATTSQMSQLSFGSQVAGVNNVNVDLTSDIRSYAVKSSSFTPEATDSNTATDNATLALGVASSIYKIGNAALMLGGPVTYGAGDILTGVASLGSSIYHLIQGNKSAPTPLTLNATQLGQPLGDWKHAVNINDWNPYCLLNVDVTPTITTAPDALRWNNLLLSIKAPNITSDNIFGVSIQYQQGQSAEQTLFRLDGIGSKDYGYYSYDFTKGSYNTNNYHQIDQNNLNFFGTIDSGVEGIHPLFGYTADNGFPFSTSDGSSGSYSFYWNDSTALGDKALQVARESSSSLTVKFDSRSLGWYWDTKFVDSSNPANPTIDPNASKLWIKSGSLWNSFSYHDVMINPLAYANGLLSHTYYQTNTDGPTITKEQIETNKLVDSLMLLAKYVTDITNVDTSSLPADKLKLQTIDQITYVEKATMDGHEGVNIFYSANSADPSSQKSEIFLYTSANGPLATNPQTISTLSLINLEDLVGIDVNDNGIIGSSDQHLLRSSNDQSFVNSLYQQVLEREPDAGGYNYWTNQLNAGLSKADVMASFIQSVELSSQFSTDANYIHYTYQQLLGRPTDSGGDEYWSAQLHNGVSRADFVSAVEHSAEFVKLIGTAA